LNVQREPEFLTREMVDDLHNAGLDAYGGARGVLNDHLLESAVNQPQNTYYLPELETFDCVIKIADHKMNRFELDHFFRQHLSL